MTPKTAINGWIILDKPLGITSAQAVGKVKWLLRSSLRGKAEAIQPDSHAGLPRFARNDVKIGHAGTLDPLASGILPLALGEATKTVSFMMDARKSYGFTVTWGEERDTDDAEGKILATSLKRPNIQDIMDALPSLTGAIQQTPPIFSAIKLNGQRAYDLARAGEEVILNSRKVMIHRLELQPGDATNQARFICHCGKGTYIRALARSMGRMLGCLGYVSELRRLQVGNFTEKQSISLELLEKMVHKDDLGFLQPVESALDDIPARDITSDQAARIRSGQAIFLPPAPSMEEADSTHSPRLVLTRCNGMAIAICTVASGSMKPVRVFNLP